MSEFAELRMLVTQRFDILLRSSAAVLAVTLRGSLQGELTNEFLMEFLVEQRFVCGCECFCECRSLVLCASPGAARI